MEIPEAQAKQIFLGNGFSEDFVDNLIEMGTAIKTRFMNYQKRNNLTTTPTIVEDFVKEVYMTINNNQ